MIACPRNAEGPSQQAMIFRCPHIRCAPIACVTTDQSLVCFSCSFASCLNPFSHTAIPIECIDAMSPFEPARIICYNAARPLYLNIFIQVPWCSGLTGGLRDGFARACVWVKNGLRNAYVHVYWHRWMCILFPSLLLRYADFPQVAPIIDRLHDPRVPPSTTSDVH